MAKLVFTNAYVSVAGVDLSDHVHQFTLSEEAAEVESTAFGVGWRERLGGLKTGSITIGFHQDFATSSVEATIGGLLGGTVAVIVQANGSTAGTANPKYSMTALVTSLQPVGGAVGDLLTSDVTWPTTGTVTKAFA